MVLEKKKQKIFKEKKILLKICELEKFHTIRIGKEKAKDFQKKREKFRKAKKKYRKEKSQKEKQRRKSDDVVKSCCFSIQFDFKEKIQKKDL